MVLALGDLLTPIVRVTVIGIDNGPKIGPLKRIKGGGRRGEIRMHDQAAALALVWIGVSLTRPSLSLEKSPT